MLERRWEKNHGRFVPINMALRAYISRVGYHPPVTASSHIDFLALNSGCHVLEGLSDLEGVYNLFRARFRSTPVWLYSQRVYFVCSERVPLCLIFTPVWWTGLYKGLGWGAASPLLTLKAAALGKP